nr:hypothetical protein [Actinomycetota bacterium]
MKRSRSLLVLMVLMVMVAGAVVFAPAATASFHATRITEVYAGSTALPMSQFIELRMSQAGQNFVNGIKVKVFDASGTEKATFTFTSNVVNGQNQAAILLATQEAQQEFGVSADLTITPVIAASGGKVCFDTIDCVSWGNYSGGADGTGAPAAPGGIPSGFSLTRNTAGGSSPGLDSGDDTNDSAADFQIASPTPTNNLGATGGSDPTPTPTPTPLPTPTPDPPMNSDHERSVSLRKKAAK